LEGSGVPAKTIPLTTFTFWIEFGPGKNNPIWDIALFDEIRRLQKQSDFGHTHFGCESGPAETIPFLTLSFWLGFVACKNNPLFDIRIFIGFVDSENNQSLTL